VATDRSGADLVTVVGALLGVQPGESLRLVGRWGSHPRYGRQFEVDSYTTVLPATIQGIERYLGSGLIKGIGPRTAGRIVGHFGVDTLRVIEEQPGRLVEVPGLGPTTAPADRGSPMRPHSVAFATAVACTRRICSATR
jgi:exodeoxyribonuclease V alpha subunit